MRRNSPSSIHSTKALPDAARELVIFALPLVACLIFTASTFSANAVGLGALDIRSYLGEPLNLRISLITQPSEEIETGCFAIINSPSAEPSISRRDVRLTLVDAKNGRYIEVRGNSPFNEPIGRLSIRVGCQSESGVVRDYPLLLDPAPLLAPAAADTARQTSVPALGGAAPQPTAGVSAQASGESGRWTVYPGDTLSTLATGIYPKNRVRQSEYITALRSLNPALASLAINAPLPPNNQLILPDLKALSATRSAPDSSTTAALGDRSSGGTSVGKRNRSGNGRNRAETNAPPTAKVAPLANAAPNELPVAEARGLAKADSDKKVAQRIAKNKVSQNRKDASASGFKLRISDSEIDLSRSQGVTDETRAQLRERFALLDADDQTAQLLALKNNVKQIEKRLNELQLKFAASSSAIPATGMTAPLSSPPNQPSAAAKIDSPEKLPIPAIAPTAPAASEKPAVDPVLAAKPVAPPISAAPQIVPAKIAPSADSSASESWLTWLIAILSLAALAALAWWGLQARRGRGADASKIGRLSSANEDSPDDFNTWINDPETTSPTSQQPDPVAANTDRARDFRDRQNATKLAREKKDREAQLSQEKGMEAVSSGETARSDSTSSSADILKPADKFATDGAASLAAGLRTSQTLKSAESFERDSLTEVALARPKAHLNPSIDSFISTTPSPDGFSLSDIVPLGSAEKAAPQNSGSFELDIDLNDLASFPANSGDQTAEDRMRRLRYMQERYPELVARTVSIDEPESIIDAARLYYEENQLGKACELLIYSVEERPQEIRYWLAQFELFRLEKMTRQYGELAEKFQLLFGASDAWPKVRDIGHNLDATNPLFAAATGAGATLNQQFDPATENWLNVHASGDSSLQHISQALVADLRASLFSEFQVTHADFQGVPDLLHSTDARA